MRSHLTESWLFRTILIAKKDNAPTTINHTKTKTKEERKTKERTASLKKKKNNQEKSSLESFYQQEKT